MAALLPQEVLDYIELESLKLEDKLLIDCKIFTHETDTLFRVKCRGETEDAFIIVEHKKIIGLKAISQVYRYMLVLQDRDYKGRGSKGSKHLSMYWSSIMGNQNVTNH